MDCHIVKHPGLLNLVIDNYRTLGRKELEFIKQIIDSIGCRKCFQIEIFPKNIKE